MVNSSFDREKSGLFSRREFLADVGIAVAGAAVVPAAAAELLGQSRAGGVQLFNGKDMSGLYTHLRGIGVGKDPSRYIPSLKAMARLNAGEDHLRAAVTELGEQMEGVEELFSATAG